MNFIDFLIAPYKAYSGTQIALEFSGTFFGLLSVYFSAKKNIWVYPTGIISTVIYVYILYHFGLWGDMMINFYYTVMSIYGWIIWAKSREDKVHVKVGYASRRDWLICSVLFVASLAFVSAVYYFKPFLENHFSMQGVTLGWWHLDWANYLDIFTTALFLVGMWLMARRKIENWIFWIVGDLICVPMMLYKELGITAIQFAVFTAMAIWGYISWKKSIAVEK